MTFFEVFCGNLLSVGIEIIFYAAVASQLFGSIPDKSGKHYRNIFCSLVLYLFLEVLIGTVFYQCHLLNF